MTVQVIPVRTKVTAQTRRTDLTAAAHQDLMEHNVNQVTVSRAFHEQMYYFSSVLLAYVFLEKCMKTHLKYNCSTNVYLKIGIS